MSDVRWFAELGLQDVPLVGGKTASLGELYRLQHGAAIGVPNGFVRIPTMPPSYSEMISPAVPI